MILNGKKVSIGWLLVLAGLIAVSVAGLRTEFSESLFNLSGDHLWANVAWMITATFLS